MQPAATGVDGTGVKLTKGEAAHGEGPVNEEKWWKRRPEDIPVDEMFFHKYFTQKSKKEKEMAEKVKKRKGKEQDEDSDGEDDEVESLGREEVSDEERLEAEGDEEDEEEESDKEEAEIWKVNCRVGLALLTRRDANNLF